MDTWKPGRPVLTTQDHADWQAWRLERRRQQQRDRRARLRRIDYHASPDTAVALDALWKQRAACDYSSIIDSIVREWLACCHRNKQVRSTGAAAKPKHTPVGEVGDRSGGRG